MFPGKATLLLLVLSHTFFLQWAEAGTAREGASDEQPDYIIVGAGGSGIQAALLLQKHNLSYTILEKENVVGSFWTKFPRFGELISINKFVRNETQQWKYDWHSMLDAPLKMRDVSSDYFPQGTDWQRYMTKVAERSSMNIEFGVHVESMANDGTPCVHLQDGTERCAKYRVLVGTGMEEKNETVLRALGGIPYSRMTKEMAREKNVCILGNGNAGFELAQNVYDVAERVILYGKHAARLSAVTRYTGDVRSKFFQVMENFHGKLLDTVYHFDIWTSFPKLKNVLNVSQLETFQEVVNVLGHISRFDCEVLALATGFESKVPGQNLTKRFPPTDNWYASKTNPKVHFIGWLMHEADFRRGSGGFLSGFRYLIRNLVHHIREQDHGIAYPKLSLLSKEQVIQKVIDRSQIADDLIILQDGVVLRDAIVPNGGGRYHYYQGIPYLFFPEIKEREDVVYFYFAWGNGRTASNVFDSVLRYSDTGHLINLFLHPVVEVKGLVRDIHEDLLMTWNSPQYEMAHHVTIQAALDGDLNLFREKPSFPYKRAVVYHTESRNHFEPADHDQKVDMAFGQQLLEVAKHNFDPKGIERLRSRSMEVFPELYAHETEPVGQGKECDLH